MGQTGSKAKSTTLTDICTSVLTNNIFSAIQNCQGEVVNTQFFGISGDNNVVSGISQTQYALLDAQCSQSTSVSALNDADLTNKIEAAATSTVKSLGAFNATKSKVQASIKMAIETINSTLIVQNCVSTVNNAQVYSITGSGNKVTNVTQEQTAESYKKCLSGSISNVVNRTLAANGIDGKAEAVTSGLLDFSDPMFILYVIIAIVILAFLYKYFMSSGSQSGFMPQMPVINIGQVPSAMMR